MTIRDDLWDFYESFWLTEHKSENLEERESDGALWGTVREILFAMPGVLIPTSQVVTLSKLIGHADRHALAYWAHYTASAADDAFSMALHGVPMRGQIPKLARFGAKAIPILGWAMLAYDIYEYSQTGRIWGVPVNRYARAVWDA